VGGAKKRAGKTGFPALVMLKNAAAGTRTRPDYSGSDQHTVSKSLLIRRLVPEATVSGPLSISGSRIRARLRGSNLGPGERVPTRLPVRPAGRAFPVLRMPGFPGLNLMCTGMTRTLTTAPVAWVAIARWGRETRLS